MSDVNLGRGRFMLGDCLERMRELPDASVDMILCDPPYSSGTRREGAKGVRKSMTRSNDASWFGSDSLTTNGFLYLLRSCAVEWARVLKDGGHCLVFIDWRMMPALAAAIESADLRHANLLVWDKTYFGMGSCFRNQHELILHFSKGVGTAPRRRDIGSVLSAKPFRGGFHPTQKPVDLLETLLSVCSSESDTVLDCFAGSGTTAVACERTGRNWVCIERDEGYYWQAVARVMDEVGSK